MSHPVVSDTFCLITAREWRSMTEGMPRPWPRAMAATDLRMAQALAVRVVDAEPFPTRTELAARWGWGAKAVRVLWEDHAAWQAPLGPERAVRWGEVWAEVQARAGRSRLQLERVVEDQPGARMVDPRPKTNAANRPAEDQPGARIGPTRAVLLLQKEGVKNTHRVRAVAPGGATRERREPAEVPPLTWAAAVTHARKLDPVFGRQVEQQGQGGSWGRWLRQAVSLQGDDVVLRRLAWMVDADLEPAFGPSDLRYLRRERPWKLLFGLAGDHAGIYDTWAAAWSERPTTPAPVESAPSGLAGQLVERLRMSRKAMPPTALEELRARLGDVHDLDDLAGRLRDEDGSLARWWSEVRVAHFAREPGRATWLAIAQRQVAMLKPDLVDMSAMVGQAAAEAWGAEVAWPSLQDMAWFVDRARRRSVA